MTWLYPIWVSCLVSMVYGCPLYTSIHTISSHLQSYNVMDIDVVMSRSSALYPNASVQYILLYKLICSYCITGLLYLTLQYCRLFAKRVPSKYQARLNIFNVNPLQQNIHIFARTIGEILRNQYRKSAFYHQEWIEIFVNNVRLSAMTLCLPTIMVKQFQSIKRRQKQNQFY
jgi:hypothetical protein